tara:strand:- start:398 stop:532 length:135 start_codon:yes stop_codon:yes gene_type:complete
MPHRSKDGYCGNVMNLKGKQIVRSERFPTLHILQEKDAPPQWTP